MRDYISIAQGRSPSKQVVNWPNIHTPDYRKRNQDFLTIALKYTKVTFGSIITVIVTF
jgi:hypothetical protein